MPMPERSEPVRVEPMQAPYPPELQTVFDQIMPPGVPPLSLFTTQARVPRIFDRFRAGSLLDRGPVPRRRREIVIDRTRDGDDPTWSNEERLLIQLVDELHDTSNISS